MGCGLERINQIGLLENRIVPVGCLPGRLPAIVPNSLANTNQSAKV
jgi:hypothetical protein